MHSSIVFCTFVFSLCPLSPSLSAQYPASMTPTPESKSSYGRPTKLCLSKSKKVANGSSGSVDSVDSSSSACSYSTEPTRATTRFRSNSIPVRKYIHKTPSELQLYEDEALADQRDHCMFSRIVSGIIRHQMSRQTDLEVRYQYDETLTNIIRTRHELDDCSNAAGGVMPSSDQGFDFDDNDWAPNLTELNGHDEGIFFLEL